MVLFMRIISIALLCFFLLSCGQNSIARLPKYVNGVRLMDSVEKRAYTDSLTKFFNELLNNKGFSGGILVAKNGEVLYEHYQGFTNSGKTDSITVESPFHVASTSKTFTSTAILQLVQQGKISLADTLQKFFHDFPYKGITIKHLLSHSSGLPYYVNFMARYGWDKKQTASNQDVLNTLHNHQPPLEFATGTAFKYCNTNFVLLALIVEQVSGRFFPDYIRDSIFLPAGMTHSYVLSHKNPTDYKPSWTASNKIYNYDYLDGIYGDKNVFTTCRDLMAYDNAIRNNGLLKQDFYNLAWTSYFRDKHYRDSIEYYGLGWRLKVFNDSLKIPYHNGWWHGNNAVFQRLIADTAVIIVTGNRFNNRIYSAPIAANIFRNYYPDDNLSDIDQLEQEVETPVNKKGVAVSSKPKAKSTSKKAVSKKAAGKKR